MSADFDAWADIYRLWTAVSPDPDAEFYRRLAATAERPVVDLGVGLGRLAVLLAPDVGIDVSGEMIAEARRRLNGSVRLVQSSIADYALDEPAGFSYAGQNTLNHVAPAEQPVLFHAVYRNTRPGGRFAFETALAQPARLRTRDRVPVLRSYSEQAVVYDITRLADAQGHRAELIGMVERTDGAGRVVERRYFPPIPFTFLTVEVVTGWATQAGWQVESVHADPQGNPVTADSPSAMWCLRRPRTDGRS
ncbi:MAG TPA: methyltransferase domain-containing protein [Kofleriaceae bacterium]|nr:methyltransferase domain-containing protein [Kofleriaceae bacterium]